MAHVLLQSYQIHFRTNEESMEESKREKNAVTEHVINKLTFA